MFLNCYLAELKVDYPLPCLAAYKLLDRVRPAPIGWQLLTLVHVELLQLYLVLIYKSLEQLPFVVLQQITNL